MTTLVNYMNMGNLPRQRAEECAKERANFLRDSLALPPVIKVLVLAIRVGDDRLEMLDV